MQQNTLFHLSTLLIGQIFLACILAVPMLNHVVNTETDLIIYDDFKKLASSGSIYVADIIEEVTVTAEPDTATVTASLVIVTVTVTTIETTIINSDAGTSGSDLTVTTAADVTTQFVDTTTSFQHASSTSSRLPSIHPNSTVTKFTTKTSKTSSSLHTSSFSDELCDDIFCNTDGNKICIYWAGVTSWDVSLGAMPGEQPTIIGTC
ncbi:hypothetical protein ONZ43_g3414 [Nemania bipapillata]|uniref:Uncharacterized protein n=1 Tax=Nemania bipapillata TaxID=110536 RepID=A0ACC2IWT9_9PEZI|nr:hypothetical protein ONZ43_g3414 [Nemania bipapillata]